MSAKCCICTDEFSGIDDLEAHISADHYNCLPFECEKCKFAKFPTEFAIKRHYEEDHGLVEYFIRYRVSREIYEKKQKIRECLERCIRVSDSAGQLGLASRNIVGDYISSITTQQSSTASNHYQNRQMHENEFLSLSSSKIRGTNLSDIFQQQHGGPMLSNSTGDRHQHHSEFSNTGPASDAGYETLNGANLIGNLLEHMKPDLDSTNLSNFDQLYSPDISTANDEQRGIDKFVPNPTQQTSQDLLFLNQKQTNVSATKKTTSVPSTSSNISTNWTSNVIRPTPPELRCQACSCMVVSRSTSLMYHVNVKHLKLAMFKCRECGEEFLWNKSAAIRHAQRHGGDENMIENNSERHFPTLNRHKREYFNLGRCTSNSTCEDSSSQYLEDAQATEIIEKHAKLELKTPEIVLTVKDEKEDDSISAADESNIGKAVNVVEVKNEQTPNSILAQLVDISRGKKNEVERGSDTIVCNNIQRRSTARERMTTAKGANAKTSIPTQSSTVSSHMVANTSTNISSYNITNTDEQKVHKSIQCGGCGDMVVNQEWIMLNHVNTKHLHLPLYKCVSCNKPFENYLRSYAVRHTKFYHAGDENLLVDQREMFWNDLREACSNLFKSGGR